MKIWKKLGCGLVMFGLLIVIGLWNTDTAFTVKNDTDTVLQIGVKVAAESPVVMTWSESSTGPLLISQTINSYTQSVFTGKLVYQGKSVSVEYYHDSRENKGVTKLPRLQVIASITPCTDVETDKSIMKKAPKIEVTKISADQVRIQVDVNNKGASVRGVSKIYVYKGSKKIKTLTSDATNLYTFTYKAKGAGSAKYKVKVEIKADKQDAMISKEVSPVKNVWKQKVSKKASDYEEDDLVFVTESISYSGKDMVVTGYTVNNMGFDYATSFYTIANCPGKLLYQYRSPANKVIKKGVHKYTFKIKNAPVVDLRHCGVDVK